MADENEWVTVIPGMPRQFTPAPAASIDDDWRTVGRDPIVQEPPAGPLARRLWETTNDAVRAAAGDISFGMADRLQGATDYGLGLAPSYGAGVAAQVKETLAGRERSPYATIAADAAAMAALPTRGGAIARAYGAGPVARATGYGAEGALVGGAQGAGNVYTGNVEDYTKAATLGSLFGGLSGAAGGAALAPRPDVSAVVVPKGQALFKAKELGYDALRKNQTPYSAEHFAAEADRLQQFLYDKGFNPTYSPQTWQLLARMRQGSQQPGGIITPANIDSIRQGVYRIPNSDAAAMDRESARHVRNALDNFMVNPPPGAVRPGYETHAQQASKLADFARGNNAAYERDKTLSAMLEAADLGAAGKASGLNFGNTLRQSTRSLVDPRYPWRARGFGPEREALVGVNAGGPLLNTARWGSNYLGGGGGLAALAATGGAVGALQSNADPTISSLAGVAAPAVGLALRLGTNRGTRKAFENVMETSRARSPLYEKQLQAAGYPMMPGPSALSSGTTASGRDFLTLEMLKQLQGQKSGVEEQ